MLQSFHVNADALRTGLIVALGSGLGALARFLLLFWLNPTTPEMLAMSVTFAVNLAACFAMGYFNPGPFWGVGFLGGFSTLSAVALASAHSSAAWALFIIALCLSTATLAFLAGSSTRTHAHV